MNKTTKIGIALSGTGILVNILDRVLWPTISALPFENPMRMPLIVILGAMIIVSPVFILIGIVVSLVGMGGRKS